MPNLICFNKYQVIRPSFDVLLLFLWNEIISLQEFFLSKKSEPILITMVLINNIYLNNHAQNNLFDYRSNRHSFNAVPPTPTPTQNKELTSTDEPSHPD